jgi:hypothetical protein
MTARLLMPLVLSAIATFCFAGLAADGAPNPGPAAPPVFPTQRLAFKLAADGGFEFDTGVLRGRLRRDGKSLGLSSVVHVPTGQVLDRSNGLCSHYRVFTKGRRYGGGAWDWPSTARLVGNGAVEVLWAPAEGRPFRLRAVYRWAGPATLDLATEVRAVEDLSGFESFLASYFHEAFTNALVWVAPEGGKDKNNVVLRAAEGQYGDWQVYPRGTEMLPLIQDGRWKLEPNPVDWKPGPALGRPVGIRKAPASGLAALLMAPPADCFAFSMPHQAEGHYSMYLSLFGRDIKAGETVAARTRLVLIPLKPDESCEAVAAREYGRFAGAP